MKAVNEIGFAKSFRFVFYTFYSVLIDLVLFSPFKIILLRLAGAKIGRQVIIQKVSFFNLHHHGFKNLETGDFCFIGDEVMLDLADQVILGDHVTLSARAIILTHINVGYKDHPVQKHYPRRFKQVKINDGSFVGAGAIILPGIIIGKGAVVGAGAVVTKNVDNKSVVAGSPAKQIRKLK